MHTKPSLDLTDARVIAAAAEMCTDAHGLKFSIAVVDESTYMQHLGRMDERPVHEHRGRDREGAQGRPEAVNRPRSSTSRSKRVSMVASRAWTPVDGAVPCSWTVNASTRSCCALLPRLDAEIAQAGLGALQRSTSGLPNAAR
jgi:hypothetical protein